MLTRPQEEELRQRGTQGTSRGIKTNYSGKHADMKDATKYASQSRLSHNLQYHSLDRSKINGHR